MAAFHRGGSKLPEDWHKDNLQKRKRIQKQYRENNKERVKAVAKAYRDKIKSGHIPKVIGEGNWKAWKYPINPKGIRGI